MPTDPPITPTAQATQPTQSGRTAHVMDAIKDLIVTRGLGPGDAVPTEAELGAELGISRNTLREALRSLQAIGVVEIRHGSGTYVGHLSLDSLVDELVFHSRISAGEADAYMRDLIEVRESLEQGLISNLVNDGLVPDLDRLSVLLARMDSEATSGSIDPRTDQEFHEVLYAPLHNPIAILLLQVFWRVFAQLVEPADDVLTATKTADRHHGILLALKAADLRGARIAMQNHFLGLRARLNMPERRAG